jgi:hypothetical protein
MEPAAGIPLLPGDLASARAVGRHGNTAKGRLDRLDALLRLYEPELFEVPGGSSDGGAADALCDVCVDVGFGDTVDTFIDFAASLRARRAAGTLRIVGTESDPRRLAAAQASLGASAEDSSLALRQAESDGWFVLPLLEGEAAPVFIRALNVLRDYHPADARRGLLTLGAQLAHGGLLMEGSASTPGHTSVVVLARRPKARGAVCTDRSIAPAAAGRDQLLPALALEAICFCVDFERRGAPKLKGPPNRWFTRQIPQLWQHQHTKAGEPGSGAGRPPASNKRKRGGERKWLGGGGCEELTVSSCRPVLLLAVAPSPPLSTHAHTRTHTHTHTPSSSALLCLMVGSACRRAVSDFLAAWSTVRVILGLFLSHYFPHTQ